MHLFKIYPKSIETIKLFQEKLMNNEFYEEEPRDGIFVLEINGKSLVCVYVCYNVAEAYILDKDENLVDCFVLSEFTNTKYKGKTLEERYEII